MSRLPTFSPMTWTWTTCLLIIDIVEDPIITEPKFPAGNGVRPHFFDTAGSVGRLVAEMDLQAVDDHSPWIGSQRPQLGLGSFGQKDLVRLGHPWLCSRSDAMPPLPEPSMSYDHSLEDTAIFEVLKRGWARKAWGTETGTQDRNRDAPSGRAVVLAPFSVMPRTARLAPGGLVYCGLRTSLSGTIQELPGAM